MWGIPSFTSVNIFFFLWKKFEWNVFAMHIRTCKCHTFRRRERVNESDTSRQACSRRRKSYALTVIYKITRHIFNAQNRINVMNKNEKKNEETIKIENNEMLREKMTVQRSTPIQYFHIICVFVYAFRSWFWFVFFMNDKRLIVCTSLGQANHM